MRFVVRVVLCLAMAAGCHHDDGPAIVEPAGPPPLPPSSGTPVGYLVDDAADLKLSDHQLARLKDIDGALATQLDDIETRMRAPVGPAGGGGRRGGGSFGGDGRHRGGAGQGAGSGTGWGAPQLHGGGDVAERAADVQVALAHAMAMLDGVQRIQARKLLDDRGIDIEDDDGSATAGAGSGSGEP